MALLQLMLGVIGFAAWFSEDFFFDAVWRISVLSAVSLTHADSNHSEAALQEGQFGSAVRSNGEGN